MKNLLLLALLLCTTLSVAQLHVSPNTTAGTDSYIYVKDQVLFVEQDIDLEVNSAGTTEASIYLREQSQLVQGTTNSTNTGTGSISVIQNSQSDAFDYNFWASPVGNPGSPGNRNFGMARVNDSLSLTNSSVVALTNGYNGSSSPLTISSRWLYHYPAGGPWTPMGSGSSVSAGYGFSMKGVDMTSTPNQNYDFRGRALNGNIIIRLEADKLTLVGNPYPSALDLNEVFHDPSNSTIDGANSFWYWDEDRSINSHFYVDNKGGFGTWIPASGTFDATLTNPGIYTLPMFMNYDNSGNPTTATGASGTMVERRFAPIAQGFMIKGAASTGTSFVTFKNSHRLYRKEGVANNSQFRSSIPQGGGAGSNGSTFSDLSMELASIPSPEDGRIPQMRINTYFNESHMRQVVLAFSPESTDGVDRGFDGLSPMDASSEAYFPIGNDSNSKPYVIQTVPFDQYKRVPIAFNIDVQSSIILTAVDIVKFNRDAYLYDSHERTFEQITGNRTAYLNLTPGEYTDRFYIVFVSEGDEGRQFNSNAQIARAEAIASVDFFQNNPAQQLEVRNPDGYDIKSASVFGMSGKLVINESNLGKNNRFTFATGNLSDGIYLVKLTTVEDIVIDYKVSVKN